MSASWFRNGRPMARCNWLVTASSPFACKRETAAGTGLPLDEMSLEDVEGILVQKAMARYGGNVSHAARALGLSRSALYRRLEKHGH